MAWIIFQYSLRIVGFCDMEDVAKIVAVWEAFSIPCESWGSATWRIHVFTLMTKAFSIPCESWGSATVG